MMTPTDKLNAEIHLNRMQNGILKMVPCTPQENEYYIGLLKSGRPLPDNVYIHVNGRYIPATSAYNLSY